MVLVKVLLFFGKVKAELIVQLSVSFGIPVFRAWNYLSIVLVKCDNFDFMFLVASRLSTCILFSHFLCVVRYFDRQQQHFYVLFFPFTARRRVGNARGGSNHSLQTLSTSDSTHSLSGDRYGRTSVSLNTQQSGGISRQPQASSSVPYIAQGSYSPYNVNGDVTDISRLDM